MTDLQREYDGQLRELEGEIEKLKDAMGSKELSHKLQGIFGGALTKMKSLAAQSRADEAQEEILSSLKEKERLEEQLKKRIKEMGTQYDKLQFEFQQLQTQVGPPVPGSSALPVCLVCLLCLPCPASRSPDRLAGARHGSGRLLEGSTPP